MADPKHTTRAVTDGGLPAVALTIGDINGIGAEVLVRALSSPGVLTAIRPIVVGNRRLLMDYLKSVPVHDVGASVDELHIEGGTIPIVDVPSEAALRFGEIDALAGKLAGDAIRKAVRMTINGDVDAIVTMPISKRALNAGGHQFPGHTEMLASLCGGEPMMILMTAGLRVAIVTIHTPLRSVPSQITWPLIEKRARQLVTSLQEDFGIPHPRIAVLGLNPHAGEDGLIGREEVEVIAPTVARLRGEGLNLEGPFPADGFFARFSPGTYDAVLAMYHDQGLIPLKLLARGGGVNFTAGLPIVRTSPDHGTAYNIAGKGMAEERSVVEAIVAATEIVQHRQTK